MGLLYSEAFHSSGKGLQLFFERKGRPFFSRGDFFLRSCPPQIAVNLRRTYEMLHCKRESYRFSGYWDPLIHTDRRTQILLLLKKNCIWKVKYKLHKSFAFKNIYDKIGWHCLFVLCMLSWYFVSNSLIYCLLP